MNATIAIEAAKGGVGAVKITTRAFEEIGTEAGATGIICTSTTPQLRDITRPLTRVHTTARHIAVIRLITNVRTSAAH